MTTALCDLVSTTCTSEWICWLELHYGSGCNSMPCYCLFCISNALSFVTWEKDFIITCYDICIVICYQLHEMEVEMVSARERYQHLSWLIQVSNELHRQYIVVSNNCYKIIIKSLWIALCLVDLFSAFITFPVCHNFSKKDIRFHIPFPSRKKKMMREDFFVIVGFYKKPSRKKKNKD